MLVIPAIDLLDGKCVRLVQGKRELCTVYSDDPIKTIEQFKKDGAKLVHVVDLNGAFEGSMKNFEIIAKLAAIVEIEVGGGVRTKERIDQLKSIGVNRIIVGTNLDELKKYGVIGGLDFKDGKLATNGWIKNKEIEIGELLEGMKEVIVTDVKTDGMLQGPNLELIKQIKSFGIEVIASGGIRSLDDLMELKKIGVNGTIIGKAIYEGKINLKEAIQKCWLSA
ncbi:MAG: 1-(5-phosphoribosyl)-5-[(5-phosphoribosylamino)methylideneamino] imidazole-4-carboxamide isomerase [Candidatus Micrarchaeota archaeon]